MSWTRSDLLPPRIEIDAADGDVAIFSIATPHGVVTMVAEVAEVARTLELRAAHIEGPGANRIGLTNLRLLAQLVMEELDYDAIDIQGAGRTTGAFPSLDHRPRFRFARRSASRL